MKLSQLKCGDEVHYEGQPHIVIMDSRRSGTKGEAAGLARVMLTPTAWGATNHEGILELGQAGHVGGHVPDIDVPVLRTGVTFHGSVERSTLSSDGRLISEKTNYTTAEAWAAELTRRTLLRRQAAEQEAEVDGLFRVAIKGCLDSGVGVHAIMKETGLSRARIYQIRDGRR